MENYILIFDIGGILISAYNKLVRSKIPEIISASCKAANCRILGKNEYIKEPDQMLDDEYAKYLTDKNIEKLADILGRV